MFVRKEKRYRKFILSGGITLGFSDTYPRGLFSNIEYNMTGA